MNNDKLAKEIALALIKEGHLRDSAFTAVVLIVKSNLDKALQS